MRDCETPLPLLRKWLRDYPDVYQLLDSCATVKTSGRLSWPDYCPLPINAAYTYLHQGRRNPDAVRLAAELTACWAWRRSRILYDVDDDMARVLLKRAGGMADSDIIPFDQLTRLPGRCIYVKAHHPELPGVRLFCVDRLRCQPQLHGAARTVACHKHGAYRPAGAPNRPWLGGQKVRGRNVRPSRRHCRSGFSYRTRHGCDHAHPPRHCPDPAVHRFRRRGHRPSTGAKARRKYSGRSQQRRQCQHRRPAVCRCTCRRSHPQLPRQEGIRRSAEGRCAP